MEIELADQRLRHRKISFAFLFLILWLCSQTLLENNIFLFHLCGSPLFIFRFFEVSIQFIIIFCSLLCLVEVQITSLTFRRWAISLHICSSCIGSQLLFKYNQVLICRFRPFLILLLNPHWMLSSATHCWLGSWRKISDWFTMFVWWQDACFWLLCFEHDNFLLLERFRGIWLNMSSIMWLCPGLHLRRKNSRMLGVIIWPVN